jgi:hypothetical protein
MDILTLDDGYSSSSKRFAALPEAAAVVAAVAAVIGGKYRNALHEVNFDLYTALWQECDKGLTAGS